MTSSATDSDRGLTLLGNLIVFLVLALALLAQHQVQRHRGGPALAHPVLLSAR